MPTEPFAELASALYNSGHRSFSKEGLRQDLEKFVPAFLAPRLSQAARQIAAENHRRWVQARMSMGIAETMQILTSILGQPGGKK